MRPTCLIIAGFDPSGGAGLTADCRQLERLGARSISVCTAVTSQNSRTFEAPGWIPQQQILRQLALLLQEFKPGFVKIGLVQDAATLEAILRAIRMAIPGAFILWDPILKASAGFSFHDAAACETFARMLAWVDLVTPNLPEAKAILTGMGKSDLPFDSSQSMAMEIASQGCAVLLKGGHADAEPGGDVFSTDLLIWRAGSRLLVDGFTRSRLAGVDRHGSGCTLSSSLLGGLAAGLPLASAVRQAGDYVHQWLQGKEFPSPVRRISRLQVLTLDGVTGRTQQQQILDLLAAGCDWLQVRSKQSNARDVLRDEVPGWARLCKAAGATCIVNDYDRIAAEAGAHGVHLGLTDTPVVEARSFHAADFVIGGTCNTAAHVAERFRDGADYVGLGPFRHTTTKANLSPILGIEGVRAICSQFPGKPIVVIGGILPSDIPAILDAGAWGVAVSSGVVAAPDIALALREYAQNFPEYRKEFPNLFSANHGALA